MPEGDSLVGASPAMQELYKSIALVASTDVPVLITGESGTGEDLIAHKSHHHGAEIGSIPSRICPWLP